MSAKSATPKPTEANVTAPDADAILADPWPLRVGGIACTVKRIRTREALALLRLVAPALGALQELRVDDVAEAAQILGGALIAAAAGNPDEFLAFVQQVVDPVDPVDRNALLVELANPDLDVLFGVADVLVAQEAAEVVGLVGKVRALAARAKHATGNGRPDGPPARGPDLST